MDGRKNDKQASSGEQKGQILACKITPMHLTQLYSLHKPNSPTSFVQTQNHLSMNYLSILNYWTD